MSNPSNYETNVFINCPFDDKYHSLMEAMIFVIHSIGLRPRCALERKNSIEQRIQKLFELIDESKYGIHDISRTELDDKNKLPRFNMPFELGVDIGCQKYGKKNHKQKVILILDKKEFRYQKYLSDIAGQDIEIHHNNKKDIICCIRNWYNGHNKDVRLPSGEWIYEEFKKFNRQLPRIKKLHLLDDHLQFPDYSFLVSDWLAKNKDALND